MPNILVWKTNLLQWLKEKKKIKLKVLYKWEFENSSWRRIVFQIENNNLLVLFFCLLLHRLLVRISLRLKNVLHGKSLWTIYFYTFFPRYLWEVKLKRAISMIQWFNDSLNFNFLNGNNAIYAKFWKKGIRSSWLCTG